MTNVNEIPEVVKSAVHDLRELYYEWSQIRYRMGTHGERGLHPKMKSLRSQIVKAETAFAKRFPDFVLVKSSDYNCYYVRHKEV